MTNLVLKVTFTKKDFCDSIFYNFGKNVFFAISNLCALCKRLLNLRSVELCANREGA